MNLVISKNVFTGRSTGKSGQRISFFTLFIIDPYFWRNHSSIYYIQLNLRHRKRSCITKKALKMVFQKKQLISIMMECSTLNVQIYVEYYRTFAADINTDNV